MYRLSICASVLLALLLLLQPGPTRATDCSCKNMNAESSASGSCDVKEDNQSCKMTWNATTTSSLETGFKIPLPLFGVPNDAAGVSVRVWHAMLSPSADGLTGEYRALRARTQKPVFLGLRGLLERRKDLQEIYPYRVAAQVLNNVQFEGDAIRPGPLLQDLGSIDPREVVSDAFLLQLTALMLDGGKDVGDLAGRLLEEAYRNRGELPKPLVQRGKAEAWTRDFDGLTIRAYSGCLLALSNRPGIGFTRILIKAQFAIAC